MARREVIAKFRTMRYFWFCVALGIIALVPLMASVFAPTILHESGSITGDIWRLILILGSLYLMRSVISGFSAILFLNSDGVYIINDKLVYTWSFVFSAPLSDIIDVSVDRSRVERGFAATVKITRKSGKEKYIRTEFLDQSADALAAKINHKLELLNR